MSDRQLDADLRARFDAQRRAEAGGAPAFTAMVARAHAELAAGAPAIAPRRLTLRRIAYGSGLAAAAAVAAILVLPGQPSSEAAFAEAVRAFQTDPALGAWRSPTAGLLDVPGRELLSTVPGVGRPQ
jgi:hypothetical protein